MQRQSVCLTAENRQVIYSNLKKFFILKGRAHDDEKLTAFCDDLCAGLYTYPEIIAGIASLSQADLSSCKIFDVSIIKKEIEEKRKEFNRQNSQYVKGEYQERCNVCHDSGVVSLVNNGIYSFAFACSCPSGSEKLSFPRWNGKDEQNHNGMDFKLSQSYLDARQWRKDNPNFKFGDKKPKIADIMPNAQDWDAIESI